jgi:hypothetical protein
MHGVPIAMRGMSDAGGSGSVRPLNFLAPNCCVHPATWRPSGFAWDGSIATQQAHAAGERRSGARG